MQASIKVTGEDADKWYAIKALSKAFVLSTSSGTESVFTELRALTELSSPFICNSHYAFQDDFFLYIVLDLALGGDLRFNLRHSVKTRFSEDRARFYTAQMILALDYMHSNGYLHRDVKPDNVLLLSTGYVKLTDMGVSKKLEDINDCRSASGTHGYMAPEIYARGHKHGIASEWFSLGVCLHEFLLGRRPYDQKKIQASAKMDPEGARQAFPLKYLRQAGHVAKHARTFCAQLLDFDPSMRLGGAGEDERVQRLSALERLQAHPWFADFPWEEVKARKYPAPFQPDVTRANCDTGITDVEEMLSEKPKPTPIQRSEQVKFAGYSYNTAFDFAEEKRRAERVRQARRHTASSFSLPSFRASHGMHPRPSPDN